MKRLLLLIPCLFLQGSQLTFRDVTVRDLTVTVPAGCSGTDYTAHANLVALWYLEEDASSRVDAAGGNDLSESGAITQDGTNYKQGTYSNDQATAGSTTNFLSIANASLDAAFPGKTSTSFTVMCWMRFESSSGTYYSVGMWDTDEQTFYLNNSFGSMSFRARLGGSNYTDTQASVGNGTWQFVVGIFDDSANTIQIFANNASDGSSSATDSLDVTTSDFYLWNLNGSSATFDGQLDACSIWDDAVSSTIRTNVYDDGYDGCGWDN